MATTPTSKSELIQGNTSAADTLLGLAGNDTLIGGSAADLLDGGLGIDSMTGNLGDDTYVVDNAADVVVETTGSGTDTIQSLISYTLAANVENLVLLGTAAINGTGNSLANTLTGNSGNNRLDGGDADTTTIDTLVGKAGDDVYVIRATSDVITEAANEGTDTAEVWITGYTVSAEVEKIQLMGTTAVKVTGNDQANELIGNSLANSLVGGDGDDTFKGGAGADTLDGGAGNDVFVIDADGVADSLSGGDGTDTVQASVSYTLIATDIENLILTGTAAINGTVATATATKVTLTGNSAANSLTGGSGADTLYGGLGNDTLNGGAGADSMMGGAGDDTYVVDDAGDTVNETVPGSGGVDTVQASESFILGTNVEHLVLTGTVSIHGTGNELANKITGNDGANTLTGGAGNDTLMGGSGNDTLKGDAGNDSLDGGAGGDTMLGGAGDDIYVVDVAGDTVTELAGEGTDTVQASDNFTLGDNVENLVLTGTAAINGTGNTLNNKITGNSGNNTLDGGAGVDTLDGGLGDDTYVVDNSLDRVIESSVNGGIDTVESSVSYTLGANLENLKLTGTSLKGTGNTLVNSLTGGTGNDTLDGGTNKDTMTGGLGDDTYYVDNAGDVVVESSSASSGNDTVITSLNNASLQNYVNVENLTLAGSALVGFGDAGDNKITGNALNNTLTGNGGADTLEGGKGNDTLVVDSADDVVIGGDGIDTVKASLNYDLTDVAHVTGVENLTLTGTTDINGTGNNLANVLTGNTGANSLVGSAGADTLDGGGGADTLDGGEGGDTYIVKTGYASLIINDTGVDSGTDTVQSSAITLTLGSGIENLVLTGTAAIDGTGNGQANKITGNSAANILDGGAGADTLDGGSGNDLFKVDNVNDSVIGGAGTDTVEVDTSAAGVFFNWTLAADVEHLTTKTGANKALSATGNALANQLTGTAQDDTLDGGAGADTLNGGAGNDSLNGGIGADSMSGGDGDDIYVVDNINDVVVDSSTTSIADWVMASVNYTLGSGIEKLTLTGTALSGTGNDGANTLIGNDGANTLNGGAGADTMAGGNGNDVYFVDSTSDVVTEEDMANQASAGTADEIRTTVTLTALAGGVERVTLLDGALDATGNELDNLLTGNSADNELSGGLGADTLDGGAGADMLRGGEGDDTYIIDATDTVIDTGGTDTVQVGFSYVLADELENLTLTGIAVINGTGNSAANVLTGNAGANILDGGAGADAMKGGAGNDVYYVDNAGDVVTEDTGKGTDRVYADVDYTLTANVEHLTLLGLALAGTGNELANQLTGNDEANTLTGGAGNDTLDGGVGSDSMVGGAGDDVYVVDNEADTVQEDSSLIGGKDTVRASISHTLTSFVENLTLTGSDDIDATGNELANTLTGNIGANRLDGGAGADAMDGGLGDDTYVVDDVKDKIVETSATGGDDTIEVWLDTNTLLLTGATWVAAANIENVVLMGSYNSNATGNKLDNMLLGNSGDNVLKGDAGADFMAGGAGDDTYDIDSSDTVFEESNEGTDTVKANFSYTLDANFENLILTSKIADNATGNGLANELTGNSMANTLNGKAGNDTLTGGLGNDIFRFDTVLSSTTNVDVIQDFVVGQDRISLENAVFEGLARGKLKTANFVLGTAAADANDYIIYDTATGNLLYDADGAGGGSAQQFATLVGVDEAPALTAASFIVT